MLLCLYIISIHCNIQSIPCVRLFTKHGDIGCRSLDKDGSYGIIFEISNCNNITFVSTLYEHSPSTQSFVALLTGMYHYYLYYYYHYYYYYYYYYHYYHYNHHHYYHYHFR